MKYKWQVNFTDSNNIQQFAQKYNIPSIIASILINKDFHDRDDIYNFFNPSYEDLYDPFMMKDMDLAIDRMKKAMANGERITIYGDYDVDGATATALLNIYLQELGMEVSFYIPNREKEGYGVSKTGIDYAAEQRSTLIITCDCGINAIDEVEYAKSKNIDTIITDHHEAREIIPNAVAVLNPKRKDDDYPFTGLCGVGVAFKFLYGLTISLNMDLEKLYKHLDLVVIGIAADIVPIISENRVLASKGLRYLETTGKVGLKALLNVSKLKNKTVKIVNIVFGLAPRINAAGRLYEASQAVKLLCTENVDEANFHANALNEINLERRGIGQNTIDEAILLLNATHDLDRDKIIILSSPNWHPGVIGIVASKLKEIYNRPVVMIAIQEGIGKGSARSITGFNIYEEINKCSDLLINFGGHKMAAGITIEENNIPEFHQRLNKIADKKISDEMLNPFLKIQLEISFQEITQKTIYYLNKMAPFGPGNMRPLFASRNVYISGMPRIVGENHLKFKVCQGKIVISAIGWKLGELYEMLISNRPLDIAYVIEENEWNGIKEIQLNIKDIHYSKK